MEKELKRQAVKQYLHYFRFWFAAVAVFLAAFVVVAAMRFGSRSAVRTNSVSPVERVYDYAGVLTEEEEQKLRELIGGVENRIQCDIVLVTMNEEMETPQKSWEAAMRDRADDFYDQNNYGYNGVHGDGVLILDNWYEGQKGSWLSTCGRVYHSFSSNDINQVLRSGYSVIDEHPFKAYKAYIETIERKMSPQESHTFPAILIFIIPTVILFIFVGVNLKSKIGGETVQANAYVAGGAPVLKEKSDQLVNKFVTTRRIPRNTGGGGHGGGGGHVSRGGVSHGGGGMRR